MLIKLSKKSKWIQKQVMNNRVYRKPSEKKKLEQQERRRLRIKFMNARRKSTANVAKFETLLSAVSQITMKAGMPVSSGAYANSVSGAAQQLAAEQQQYNSALIAAAGQSQQQ